MQAYIPVNYGTIFSAFTENRVKFLMRFVRSGYKT